VSSSRSNPFQRTAAYSSGRARLVPSTPPLATALRGRHAAGVELARNLAERVSARIVAADARDELRVENAVMVASVDQLIVSKEAAGRAKDREAVAELRRVRSRGRDPEPPDHEG
jgi:hypothetical protein